MKMAILIFLMSVLLVTSLSKQLKRKGSSQKRFILEGLRRWEVTVALPPTVRIGKQ